MSHLLFLLLMSTVLAIIFTVNGQTSVYESKSLDINISKDEPKSVSINCSLAQDTKSCSWRLGSTGKSLSNNDYSNATVEDRYSVKMDSLLRTCFLDITEVNFDDRGYYSCSLDEARPKILYYLTVNVNPGSPVISYANGIPIDETTIAVDVAPITIELNCLSSGARPEHFKIQWLIDGKIPTQTTSLTWEAEDGSWTASSNVTLSFSEEDQKEFAIKTVTCLTDHETGEETTTKVFGIRNPDKTVRLVHDNSTDSPHGLLKCETRVFPWPILYEIATLSNPPSSSVVDTHTGQELVINEDGRYICRAMVIVKTSPSRVYRWIDSNVVGVGVDPDCPPGTASKSKFEICLMLVNLLMLYLMTYN